MTPSTFNLVHDFASAIPRAEHPNPQFQRTNYLSLNGAWTFRIDDDGKLPATEPFRSTLEGATILVPFCPESKLSGIEQRDFMTHVIYQREFSIPQAWRTARLRILLHFGAVDCDTQVFVNDAEVGSHHGGQSAFTLDITDALTADNMQRLTLLVTDDLRSGLHGSGKQCLQTESNGCFYTRVTGIWQSVYLEAVGDSYLKQCQILSDYDQKCFRLKAEFSSTANGMYWEAEAFANGKSLGKVSGEPQDVLVLKPTQFHDWSPSDPFLYDLKFRLFAADGKLLDEVSSYAGMRKIEWRNRKLYLNNQEIFLRLVLDQGYYPDGVWTAPTESALRNDIHLGMQAGFNGARLHQKVFEPRYHYWADRLGYLTFAEYGSWSLDSTCAEARNIFLHEWSEVVQQLRNHPSIIAWTPLNESCSFEPEALRKRFPDAEALATYRQWLGEIHRLTHQLDGTRPVNDSSGYVHACTDLWSVHAYRSNVADLRAALFPADAPVLRQAGEFEPEYAGQPYLNDEFGGFLFVPLERRSQEESRWGYYGLNIQTPEELCQKIQEQTDFMIGDDRLAGYCYTQLTDIEQEQNGLYCYDRTPKCPPEAMAQAFGKKPERSRW